MNANEEKLLLTTVELMSNEKLYILFDLIIDELNKRKAEKNERHRNICE